jgi:hypothetical protein
MARKNLLDTLNFIEARIYKNAAEFRRLVSDRKAHTINIDKKDLIFQITAEMQFRLGMKKLPESMEETIEKEVTQMVRKFFVELHPKKFNTPRKTYETSGLKGSLKSFSVTYATKDGKEQGNVFKNFKRLKQQVQKPLLKALNKEITNLNKGRAEGKRFSSINPRGAGFLDIGHADESSVSLQRRQAVNKALFDFDTSTSPEGAKFIKELKDTLKLKGSKQSLRYIDNINISLESKNINRDSFTKGEVSNLNKQLRAEIERLGGQYWVEQEGSDSRLTIIEKEIVESITPKRATKVTKRKKGRISRSRVKGVTSKGKKVKSAAGAKFKDKTPARTKKPSRTKKGVSASPLQLLGIINQRLPETVRKNMREPGLVNRTGRFADSVKVTDISATKKGFPSVGYTYDRANYGQYEASSGSRFADVDRDPRTLIDKSIREIAANMAIGRFFTRRI